MAADVITLEALATPVVAARPSLLPKLWRATWPKLLAVALFIGGWQVIVWTGWKSQEVIPSPFTVFNQLLFHDFRDLATAGLVTLRRGVLGYLLAIVIGGAVGIAVARSRILRAGVGSMVTGLQTMPSVAWVPLAIVLFQLGQGVIFFVVVLGAAPSIANGIVSGIDQVPPVLLRAGRVLGARGFTALRHVVIPAAFPSVVSGLKQGWAFAWRSLMAAELITNFPGHIGIGQALNQAQANIDYVAVYEAMIVIFVIGVAVDALFFGTIERSVRRRYGLVDAAER